MYFIATRLHNNASGVYYAVSKRYYTVSWLCHFATDLSYTVSVVYRPAAVVYCIPLGQYCTAAG